MKCLKFPNLRIEYLRKSLNRKLTKIIKKKPLDNIRSTRSKFDRLI